MTQSKKAYSLPEAAEVASVGLSTLKAAIERGDLPKRYPSGRPIVLATDLEKWLESLPTEAPKEKEGAL